MCTLYTPYQLHICTETQNINDSFSLQTPGEMKQVCQNWTSPKSSVLPHEPKYTIFGPLWSTSERTPMHKTRCSAVSIQENSVGHKYVNTWDPADNLLGCEYIFQTACIKKGGGWDRGVKWSRSDHFFCNLKTNAGKWFRTGNLCYGSMPIDGIVTRLLKKIIKVCQRLLGACS